MQKCRAHRLWREMTYPALIREDESQHTTSILQSRAFSNNGSRHRVVAADSDTHQQTETEQVPELVVGRLDRVWQSDDENYTNDSDDHLIAVDELAAKSITHEAEHDLADDVSDVGSSVDGTTKKKWVSWLLHALKTTPVFVLPDGSYQIDDEKIVGINEETNTARLCENSNSAINCHCDLPANHVQLQITPGHDLCQTLGLVCALILLNRDDVAILVTARVCLFLPLHGEGRVSSSTPSVSLLCLTRQGRLVFVSSTPRSYVLEPR